MHTEKIESIQDLINKSYQPKSPKNELLPGEPRRRRIVTSPSIKIGLSSGHKVSIHLDCLVADTVVPISPKAVITGWGRDLLRVPRGTAPSQASVHLLAERPLSQLVLSEHILIFLSHIQRPATLDDEFQGTDDKRFGAASQVNAQAIQFLRNEVIGNLGNFVQRIRDVRQTGGTIELSTKRVDGSTGFLGILANHLHNTLLLDVTYSRKWLDTLYEELRVALTGAEFRSSWGRLYLLDGHLAVDFARIPSLPESEKDELTFQRWTN